MARVVPLLAAVVNANIDVSGKLDSDQLTGSSADITITDGSGASVCSVSLSKTGDTFKCDLDWSKDYFVAYKATLAKPIDETYVINADVKIKASLVHPTLKIGPCQACGKTCTFKVPVIGTTVTFAPPPCPITSASNQSIPLILPKDPSPIKASFTGTGGLTVAGQPMGQVSFSGGISKTAAEVAAAHDAHRQKAINEINAKQSLWKAGHNPRFRGQPVGAMKPMLGVLPSELDNIAAMVKRGEMEYVATATRDIPADFDSAVAFPKCAKVINDIRDQSACGCCWAFGSAEAASDRLCTQTNGSTLLPLSAQDLCFCSNSNGCGGGQPSSAWNYIKSHGLVTGSQQQPDDGKTDPFAGMGYCSKFSLPHCHHHGPTGGDPYPAEKTSGCPNDKSPKCPTSCDSDAKAPHNDFAGDKVKVSKVATYGSADAIAQALMDNGPLTASFTVYSDFENYASGIYKRSSLIPEGGHAVKFVGFGTDPSTGTKYWKIANSWNPYWGEEGFFRIVRGSNECGIENGAVGSTADATWTVPKWS